MNDIYKALENYLHRVDAILVGASRNTDLNQHLETGEVTWQVIIKCMRLWPKYKLLRPAIQTQAGSSKQAIF